MRNSVLVRREASCSPSAPRLPMRASISSRKTVEGAWYRASSNSTCSHSSSCSFAGSSHVTRHLKWKHLKWRCLGTQSCGLESQAERYLRAVVTCTTVADVQLAGAEHAGQFSKVWIVCIQQYLCQVACGCTDASQVLMRLKGSLTSII